MGTERAGRVLYLRGEREWAMKDRSLMTRQLGRMCRYRGNGGELGGDGIRESLATEFGGAISAVSVKDREEAESRVSAVQSRHTINFLAQLYLINFVRKCDFFRR